MLRSDGDRGNNSTVIIEMNNNQFPFGCNSGTDEGRKVVVKKVYSFRSEEERVQLMGKLAILKEMYHRNVVNLRSIEEEHEKVIVYYHYVPYAIETAFPCLSQAAFKQVHKQLIQLAIHLAKHYVLTTFSPSRCGVVLMEDKFIVKYFLPPAELVVTRSRSKLERSVQLFKVQAMHMLDNLAHHDLLSDLSSHDQSQPQAESSSVLSTRRNRKMSIQMTKERRFSNFCSKMDRIARKKSQDSSTQFTGVRISGLKSTLKNFKMQSQRKRTSERSKQRTKQRVELLRIRSGKAIKTFQALKKEIRRWVVLANLIRLCNQL